MFILLIYSFEFTNASFVNVVLPSPTWIKLIVENTDLRLRFQTFSWLLFAKLIFSSHSPFHCYFPPTHSLPSPDNQHRNASAWPISPLMAVITPLFSSMSLIHSMVCFLLCCSLSILIKSELNDQQWLSAGAHPSQHVAEERPPVAFIYVCSRLQTRLSMCSLCGQCKLTLWAEKNMYWHRSFIVSYIQHTAKCSSCFTPEACYWGKC